MSPHSFSRRPERVPERTVKIGPRQSQPSWPNKIGQKENFNLGTNVGNPEYLARSGSQSEWRIRFILLARGFSHIRRVLMTLSPVCLCLFIILQGLQPLILFLILRSGLNAVTLMKRSKPDWKVNRRYTNAWVWKNQSPNFLHLCLTFLLFQCVIIELFTWEQQTEKDKEEFGESQFLF